ncbi:MAG: type I-F CRISPR-associated helicase Cas3f [Sulfurovum sp.]
MMVTFISQCEKNALKKTRRVLDSFANRIGDNTWQTIITQEGLNAVHKLLRKTASKSSAISCHWIRSRSRTELLWVVGNRERFNSEGIVPVNRTKKTILDKYKESDWKYLELIKSLTALSALFHDWGKSTTLFQTKLKPNSKIKGDPIRHEWISCMLLSAFISQNPANWLERLSKGEIDEASLLLSLKDMRKQKSVLKDLPSSAKLILWLIVSHHRLPLDIEDINSWQEKEALSIEDVLKYINQSWGYENRRDEEEYQALIERCFEFPHGLLQNATKWLQSVKKWSRRMIINSDLLNESIEDGSYRVVLHHSRLCLMLGDHHYSSQDNDTSWRDKVSLFANTDSKTKQMKQKLDEHLFGVMASALKTIHLLPAFEKEPPIVADNRALKKASPKAYDWQDKAVENIKPQLDSKEKEGFFAVNMASTGCGKTFANAKIMRAVSQDKESLRYILALGLRTLTLQTGDEYRDKVGLEDDELAVLIGSKAVLELHQDSVIADAKESEDNGSESIENLLDEYIDFDCAIPEEGLNTILRRDRDKQFLYAPVLVCTIDHLMGAVTTKRGGKYILPSLRLMSSDLVIDEIDDFTGSDLVAIARLVHLAGMLGRKVMISSATIPPDLAEGYFNAYQKGWDLFTKTREAKSYIICAWIDEFGTKAEQITDIKEYNKRHTSFVNKRVKNLAKGVAKRKLEIVKCHDEIGGDEESYFEIIKTAMIKKHYQHNTKDSKSDISVSFGVVRMANIKPCVELAKYLMSAEYPEELEVRVMAYHSNQVLLLRHIQERHLDKVLKRKEKNGEEPKAFENSIIRSHLDSSKSLNMLFIVVATPVEEVGRDHDFDWSIIEPSSYRSIIQLAGRVSRHRENMIEKPNIGLLEYNLKSFKYNDDTKHSFQKPGYEEGITLKTHNLSNLIDTKALSQRLDATARIQKPTTLKQKESLSDLEHYQTGQDLTSYDDIGADTLQGYLDESWFLTAHPYYFHPFRKSSPSIKIFLTYDEKSEAYFFTQYDKFGKIIVDIYDKPINREFGLRITHIALDKSLEHTSWLLREYDSIVEDMSISKERNKKDISLRYGELNFLWSENTEYEYSDLFGLVKV